MNQDRPDSVASGEGVKRGGEASLVVSGAGGELSTSGTSDMAVEVL